MSYENDLIRSIAESAAVSFKDHVCDLEDSGKRMKLWHCHKPGTINCSFRVLVQPGWLIVTGDLGFLALSRCCNMVDWFRNSLRDRRYICEKAPRALADACLAARSEVMIENLREALTLDEDDVGKKDRELFDELIRQLDCGSCTVAEAYRRLYEESRYYRGDPPLSEALTPDFLWPYQALCWWLEHCNPAELRDGEFTYGEKTWRQRVKSMFTRLRKRWSTTKKSSDGSKPSAPTASSTLTPTSSPTQRS